MPHPRENVACSSAEFAEFVKKVSGIPPKQLGVCARKEMSHTLRKSFKIELKWGDCGLVVSTDNC